MLWDPFLIKKLLKSVICGTCEQCTDALFTMEKSNVAAKKKKRERTNVDAAFSPIQTGTKYLVRKKVVDF